ncbi:MAG: gamma-glutamyl-gamma-aminobutyrate hydrolase family protein [Pseudomonadota bacterium]
MQPLIAITSDLKHVEPYNWHATPSPYVDAVVAASQGLPIIVPSIGDALDIDTLLDRVDGVLVTGSRSNVHPSHYGEEATADHEPFDPARDATTLPLIRRAIERGVPLLAICRGIQELNVAMGGSITAAFQKNREIEGHGYPWEGTLDERFALAHEVDVEPGSCLANVLQSKKASVNSLHTQALDTLGERVVVEARAADGTIEAVTVADAPGYVVGVQWHPEYWATTDTASNKILASFGRAARTYANTKANMAVAAE